MSTEHFDVLIVGAGLSGIGTAYHLQSSCPTHTYTILEARDSLGGTWDLFRYPGIRSDSDMYTLGYRFRPWSEPEAIAEGPAILDYLHSTAREFGIDRRIRYRHRATHASWSSADARWTVEVDRPGGSTRFTCGFLYMCTGYYEYTGGYTPELPGMGRFAGVVVHPQEWPADLDHRGKRIVVIGSGATAVTLVPALAQNAAHVVMLQRSPTYIVSRPRMDPLAERLRRRVPMRLLYPLIRAKNVLLGMMFYSLARRKPGYTRELILKGVRAQLGPEYDVEKHFDPRYDPWDQRLCLVPDADLFAALRAGTASVVTGEIEAITESGVALRSGEHVPADVIVTATGLSMRLMGGLEIDVDGTPVEIASAMSYRGMMFGDVPNLAYAFGYTNASWTLKCELTARYVCRLLRYMERHGFVQCTPRRDPAVEARPAITFNSGYVQRALHRLPSQGTRKPWRMNQNYLLDLLDLKFSRLNDGTMEFRGAGTGSSEVGRG